MMTQIKDLIQGKAGLGQKRSSLWNKVRKNFLIKNNKCAVCGGSKSLEVHHKKPFHLHPDLELNPKNLITLCEAKTNGVTCHLLFGHLGNYKSINVNVDKDVKQWNNKLKNRPK